MTSYREKSVVDKINMEHFIGESWLITERLRQLVARRAEGRGAKHFSELGTRLVPSYLALRGQEYLTWDKVSNSISPVRTRAEHPVRVHQFPALDRTILISRDSTAFMLTESDGDSFYDGEFLAFELVDRFTALWVWGLLNSEYEAEWTSLLKSLNSRTRGEKNYPEDFFVPRVMTGESLLFEELESLLNKVNRNILNFEEEKSFYKTLELQREARWFLRELPTNVTKSKAVNLESLIHKVISGRSSKAVSHDGLESTAGRWLIDGKSSGKKYSVDSGSVVAQPGDIIYNAVGPKGRARQVSERMLVANWHFLIEPKFRTKSDLITSFLNSRFANEQRRHFLSSGPFGALGRQDLLNFQFAEVEDYRELCRQIMKKTGLL